MVNEGVPMVATQAQVQTEEKFYCVFIREEQRYVTLCRFNSRQEAEQIRDNIIAHNTQYTPSNFKVMTGREVSQQFGTDWVRVHTAYA
jgi:hypothetical protein